MSISTQNMGAKGDNFYHFKTAPPPSTFGPLKVTKRTIYTTEEIKELRDALRDLLEPL